MEVKTSDQSIMEGPPRTRHSTRLLTMAAGKIRSPSDPLGLSVPTGQRTSTQTRPRNLLNDDFVSELTQLGKELKSDSFQSMNIASQKEREVAEALSSLKSAIFTPELSNSATLGDLQKKDGLETTSATRNSARHRNRTNNRHLQRSSKANGRRKSNSLSRKKSQLDSEDGSYSSGSYERMKSRTLTKSKNQSKEKSRELPKRPFIREHGRRVYNSGSSSVDYETMRRQNCTTHLDYPSKRQQLSAPRGLDTVDEYMKPPERGQTDGETNGHGEQREDPISQLPDERYFPVALMDALKNFYGSGVICTTSEVQKVEDIPYGRNFSLTQVSQLDYPNGRDSEMPNHSNLAMKNNSRHLYLAYHIQNKIEKQKQASQDLISFNQNGVKHSVKHMPSSCTEEMEATRNQLMFPSLPMPVSFSNLSMPLACLPQSFIKTMRNSVTSMNGISRQCPPFSQQPPPLVRASEQREENQ